MRFRFLIVLALIFPLNSSVSAAERHSQLTCAVGPLHKKYGGTPWLVYSCNDNKTLIVITATGSPAMPYVFKFSLKGGRYRLKGEGKGSHNLTKAAYKDLHKLSHAQIQRMIAQTKKESLRIKKLRKKRLVMH